MAVKAGDVFAERAVAGMGTGHESHYGSEVAADGKGGQCAGNTPGSLTTTL